MCVVYFEMYWKKELMNEREMHRQKDEEGKMLKTEFRWWGYWYSL